MEGSRWNLWLERTKNISIIVTCVSVMGGIYSTLSTVQNTWRQNRLAGISQARDVIKEEDEVTTKVNSFLTLPPKKSPKELLEKYKTGRAMYYSRDLAVFREISHHYEEVGALINAGYIDFDLYYEIEAFPDEFWQYTSDLRSTIKQNWNGENRPLRDFLKNFQRMKERYEEKRESSKFMIVWETLSSVNDQLTKAGIQP